MVSTAPSPVKSPVKSRVKSPVKPPGKALLDPATACSGRSPAGSSAQSTAPCPAKPPAKPPAKSPITTAARLPPTAAILAVDVSKTHLDCFAPPATKGFRILNAPADRARLADLLLDPARGGPPPLVVVEASGGYERPLQADLTARGIPVAVVNPKRVRDFARANGRLAKTDQLDAQAIAEFAQVAKPRPVPPPDKARRTLAELLAYRETIQGEITARRQQTEGYVTPLILRAAEQAIARLKAELAEMDAAIASHIAGTETLAALERRLRTCPGVGPQTAAWLIATLPELGTLCSKRIASLAGLAPFARDSGQMKGKRLIWGGRPKVRRALYMAAMSAARHNPTLKPVYEALRARGKPHKLAIVATMRRLLVALNAMVHNNKDWTPRNS